MRWALWAYCAEADLELAKNEVYSRNPLPTEVKAPCGANSRANLASKE